MKAPSSAPLRKAFYIPPNNEIVYVNRDENGTPVVDVTNLHFPDALRPRYLRAD